MSKVHQPVNWRRPSRPSDYSDDQGGLASRVVHGGTFMLVAQAGKTLIVLAALAVMARILAPADYGLLAMLMAFVGVVGVFKDLGLSVATVQRPTLTQQELTAVFWINACGGLVLWGAAVGAGVAASSFFDDPRLAEVAPVAGTAFVFSALAAQHVALLARAMRFRVIGALELLSQLAGHMVGVGLAVLNGGLWSLVVIQPVAAAVLCGLAWVFEGWRPVGYPQWRCAADHVRFGGRITGAGLMHYFARNADNVLIGRALGAEALGVYSRAYSLLTLPASQVIAPLGNVVIPAMSRIATGDPERLRKAFSRLLTKVALGIVPSMVVAIAAADWIVALVLGPQWEEAARLFAILGIASLVEPIASTFAWLMTAEGRARALMFWSAVNAGLVVTAIVIGLRYGLMGVAWSYAGYAIARMPVLVWFACRGSAVAAWSCYQACVPGTTAGIGAAWGLYLASDRMAGMGAVAGLLTVCAVGGVGAVLGAMVPRSGRAEVREATQVLRRITARVGKRGAGSAV